MKTDSRAPESLNIDRRQFLKMVGGVSALTATHGLLNFWPNHVRAEDYEEALANRRNIIIFTTDQQQQLRWFPDGWEEANLPGLTRLRNKGVSFHRAYTNTAMCTPSRTTLFTGLYPAQHRNVDTLSEGMVQSEEEHQLNPSLPNIGTIFKAAGYDVVWKGKWHLSKGVELPDGDYTSDDISRYGMNGWNSPDAGGDAKISNYGGGTVNNDGRYFDGHTWQDPVGDPSDPDYMFTQADGPINAEWEHNSVMAFLRHKIENPGDNPFCLIICLINPHDVLGAPGVPLASGGNGTYIEGGYYDRGDGTSPWTEQSGPLPIQLPPTVDENLLLNHKPHCQPAFLAASAGLGPVPTNALKLEYLNFYGNLMKMVDRYLVQMLDLLDGDDPSVDPDNARELRDGSWVIFTSDHGDMAMAHGGMRQKSFQIYEETANVPFVWSNPVDFPTGQDCHELISHIDFLPTLCTLSGIDPELYDLRGVDYSALIENPASGPVQDAILFTFDDIWSGQNAAGNPNGIVPAPNRLRALIEKDYKYVYYFDGLGVADPQEEFYDLRSHAQGGTDTDVSAALGTTGKAIEYTNYSQWAQGERAVPLVIPPAIVAKRDQMESDLQSAITNDLQPLPEGAAVPPEQFDIKVYNWLDGDDQKQTELQITWMSSSTTQYQVQSSTNLVTWQDLGDPIPGNNGTLWLNQPVSDKLFYRLAWSPLPEAPIPEPTT